MRKQSAIGNQLWMILPRGHCQLRSIRYAESMPVRNSERLPAISRIGQRRQVVIPKAVFEALQLREGDFVEMTVEHGRVAMRPKRLVDDGS